MTAKKDSILTFGNSLAYLTFASAAVIKISNSRNITQYPSDTGVVNKTINDKSYKIVPRGVNNDLPQLVANKVSKNPDLASNIPFKISMAYGESVLPVTVKVEAGANAEVKKTYLPVTDQADINEFFENNNINDFIQNQLTDLIYFGTAYPEIITDQQLGASRRILELRHKDAVFSRLELQDENGKINNHFYADWANLTQSPNIDVTPYLDPHSTILDLKRRIGAAPDATGKTNDEKQYRYIIPNNIYLPGSPYYSKPPFWSLFESGWYDFAQAIPEFKTALMKNQMTIKYMVYVEDTYFEAIFKEEAIKDPEEQKARITQEYKNIQDFLTNSKNAGKAIFGKIKYKHDGKEVPSVKIVAMENKFVGGEYIQDSEEVSNIMAYAMGIHSSLIGSHGKGGTINGTEARELFIIQQSLTRYLRDKVVKSLYVVKAINNWPPEIQFYIPNIQLTTLDKGTGSTKVIS